MSEGTARGAQGWEALETDPLCCDTFGHQFSFFRNVPGRLHLFLTRLTPGDKNGPARNTSSAMDLVHPKIPNVPHDVAVNGGRWVRLLRMRGAHKGHIIANNYTEKQILRSHTS